MITSFSDYEKEYIKEYPIEKDDAEQIWDFLQERSDSKMKLAYELEHLLEAPIELHFEWSKGDQTNDANEFRNDLHRIKKIVEALKK